MKERSIGSRMTAFVAFFTAAENVRRLSAAAAAAAAAVLLFEGWLHRMRGFMTDDANAVFGYKAFLITGCSKSELVTHKGIYFI